MAQEDLYLLAEKIKLERESMNKKEIKVEADDKLDSLRRSDWLFNNQPKKVGYFGGFNVILIYFICFVGGLYGGIRNS